MRVEQDVKLDFNDVLIKPKRSTIASRKEVDLTRSFTFKYSPYKWTGIPIISSNMSSVTTAKVAEIMIKNNMLAGLPKQERPTNLNPKHLIRTLGIADRFTAYIEELFICLDVANGYTEKFIEKIQRIPRFTERPIIIAGNIVTPEMTEALILAGADIVKVGLGSGSACLTRAVSGVGYPQLSAIIECADAAHGLGGHIISDGGCITPGDIAKAFGAGADFVMLGGMLAGFSENGQEFYGMSSKRANEETAGGLKDYRAAEGLELNLPPRGKLEGRLQEILGGLRSAGAYMGARKIKDFPKCCTFIRVNRQMNTSLHGFVNENYTA